MAILDTQAVNAVLQHLEPGTWKLLGPRDDRLVPVTAPHSVSYIAVCSPTGVADTLRTFALNTIPGIWEPVRHKSGWNSTWMRVPLAEASRLVAFTDYGPTAQVPLKYDPANPPTEWAWDGSVEHPSLTPALHLRGTSRLTGKPTDWHGWLTGGAFEVAL
ncbi:MAG: DUF6527 family protein [Rhodospirillaceae bacterium]|nr:DUF6527 family protein [Rhodospirillaceae bacterium]